MSTEKQINKAQIRLYKAVANYVKVRGGVVLVAGGIQVQEWPEDAKNNYRIAVKCTGSKPELTEWRG